MTSEVEPEFNTANVEQLYTGTSFELRKGTKISLLFTFENDLDQEDKMLLPSFLAGWTYGEDRYIKPFRLHKCEINSNNCFVEIEIVRKNKQLDEIKLLLIDFVSAYEVIGNPIINVRLEQKVD
ncbi:hypothetical protein [Brevibacillus choshinensis]|uniref:hypothetical protein n=1 Tax=Brevibacillus choshinensis TaxID=54911 RepID=UPI002E24D45A|nr:hypothetical protein [Brevibacillus choshinensis]MED4754800.1 hypothetical protein [Brevibacillus choshinensis]